jgi:hypothetical protein
MVLFICKNKFYFKRRIYLGNRHNWTEKTLGSNMLKCTKCGEETPKKGSYWDKVSNRVCVGNEKFIDEYISVEIFD